MEIKRNPSVAHFKYSWMPDLPDHRDMKYENHLPILATLPAKVDRRPWQSPVKNQQSVGCCVGEGSTAALEELELWELREKIDLNKAPEEFDMGQFDPISELFVYANGRIIEGTPVTEDSGMAIRDAITAVQKYGICREVVFPFSEQNAFITPPASAYDEGNAHKKIYGYRVDNTNLHALKSCLASGSGVIMGMSVYESFEYSGTLQTGIVPYPGSNEQLLGGHCMFIVGYDDAHQWFIVKNSWGSGIGVGGYMFIPYRYLTNGNLADDFWTLRRVSSVVAA